jgi:hypothetical protein
MISKELLSEALGVKTRSHSKVHYKDNTISYEADLKIRDIAEKVNSKQFLDVVSWGNINIHELANKCKGWAYEHGYAITSGVDTKNSIGVARMHKIEEVDNPIYKYYNETTEPEAIFKACQWILENKDD